MKKIEKRTLSVILSLVMLLAMSLPAFANTTTEALPTDLVVVWKNDFNDVEGTPSGNTTQYESAIDYRPQNAAWEIRTKGGNAADKYFYFVPKSEQLANAGNDLGGYWDVAGDSKDPATYPSPIDKFPIDKLVLNVSVMFESLRETQLCSYYEGKLNGKNGNATWLMQFTDKGKILLSSDVAAANSFGVEVGTYTPGAWIDLSMYVDFQKHTIIAYNGDTYLGKANIPNDVPYFNQIRFRAQGASDNSNKGISVDNIQYLTTYSQAYVDRDAYRNAYSTEVAKIDFADKKLPPVIDETTNSEEYFFTSVTLEPKAIIVYDAEKGHNVASIKNGKANKFGISDKKSQNFYTYKDSGKYPNLVRVEAEVKKVTDAQAVYLYFDSTEVVRYNGSNKFEFNHNGTSSETPKEVSKDTTKAHNTWVNISLLMDFGTGKYKAYIDDVLYGEYAIPSAIKTPEKVCISRNSTSNELYIDYISITTLPPYGEDKVVKYFDENVAAKVGYVLSNTTEDTIVYDVFRAKYDAEGKLTEVVKEKTRDEIPADTMVLKELDVQQSDEGHYEYYVWKNSTIVPLLNKGTIQ